MEEYFTYEEVVELLVEKAKERLGEEVRLLNSYEVEEGVCLRFAKDKDEEEENE